MCIRRRKMKEEIASEEKVTGSQIADFSCLSSDPAKAPDGSIPTDKFPPPTGKYPYTIELNDVLGLPPKEYKQTFSKGIAFHTVGDTGGEAPISFLGQVIESMKKRLDENKYVA